MEINEIDLCTICGKNIPTRSTLRGKTTKNAYFCGLTKMMHKTCAKEYCVKRYPESATTFSLDTWDKTEIEMLCLQCRVDCLFCNKPHNLKNNNVSFVECTTRGCTHWSFFLTASKNNNKGCVSKSEKLMKTVTCLECDKNQIQNDRVKKKGRNYKIYQLMALTMNCQAFL